MRRSPTLLTPIPPHTGAGGAAAPRGGGGTGGGEGYEGRIRTVIVSVRRPQTTSTRSTCLLTAVGPPQVPKLTPRLRTRARGSGLPTRPIAAALLPKNTRLRCKCSLSRFASPRCEGPMRRSCPRHRGPPRVRTRRDQPFGATGCTSGAARASDPGRSHRAGRSRSDRCRAPRRASREAPTLRIRPDWPKMRSGLLGLADRR